MKITNAGDLEEAIMLLQQQSYRQRQELGAKFNGIIESLKPANLLKSAVNNIREKPGLVNAAMGTSVAIGVGALSKKLVIGKSGGLFKKLLGGLIEFTVSKTVANNFGAIADKGLKALRKISR